MPVQTTLANPLPSTSNQQPVTAKKESQIGFGISLITTLAFLVYNSSYMYMVIETGVKPWLGIEAYQATLKTVEFAPQIIGLLLIPALVATLVCIHSKAAQDKKIWSLVGLAFGIIFAVIVESVYFVQVTIVRQGLLQGELEGLAMLVMANSGSVSWAADLLGWGFLGLATLFTGLSFQESWLEKWIRRLFIANGLLSILAIFGYLVNSLPLQIGVLISWTFGLPLAFILITIWFWQTRN